MINMKHGETDLLFYLGGICLIHQLVFTLILFLKKSDSHANRVLALFMLIFGGVHLDDMLIFTGTAWKYHYINETVHFLFFFLGPLYLRYTEYMTGIRINWRKHAWLHVLPFIIAAIYVVHLSFMPAEVLRKFYTDMITRPPVLNSLLNFFTGLQMGIYLVWSLRLVNRYNRRIRHRSYYRMLNLQWLRAMTIWLLLICYVIAPGLLLCADFNAAVLYAFQPIMTTVIYLFLLYRSVSFPGPDYEQQLIRQEERQKIRWDIYNEIGSGISRITLLSEAAKMGKNDASQLVAGIAEQNRELGIKLYKFVEMLGKEKDNANNQ